MTRATIIYEGIDQGFGYIVEPGATEWEDGKEYPIVNNFNFDDLKDFVGYATDVRREENNEITCEVPNDAIIRLPPNPYSKKKNQDPLGDPLVSFAAFTYGIQVEPPFVNDLPEGETRTITKCVLKAVGRIPISAANPAAG